MAPIKVTFAELGNAHTDIASSASRINSQLDDLKGYVARLAATWDGDAAMAYRQKQQEWDRAALGINDVLRKIGRAVDEANLNYQTTETANAGRWR